MVTMDQMKRMRTSFANRKRYKSVSPIPKYHNEAKKYVILGINEET